MGVSECKHTHISEVRLYWLYSYSVGLNILVRQRGNYWLYIVDVSIPVHQRGNYWLLLYSVDVSIPVHQRGNY